MSGKLPYYKRFPKDYLSDENVAVMSLEEEGAYNRLMDYCWLQGSIPNDVDRLASMCRVSPEKMGALWPAIRPCFDASDESGRLAHPRMDRERRQALNRKKKLSEAGKKGARVRDENREKRVPGKPADYKASQATLKPGLGQDEATLKHSQKSDTDKPLTPLSKSDDLDGADMEVFEYWRTRRAQVIGKDSGPPMQPTAKRMSKIRARLKQGYSPDQLKQAVDGCLSRQHNVDGGYLDIELICRDQTKVELYRTAAKKAGRPRRRIHMSPAEVEEWDRQQSEAARG